MKVTLIDHARDPLTKLYGAYRVCYSPKTPEDVWADIADGKVTPETIAQFVKDRLATGHASPMEQVVFWFGISGVSRSLSHQLVRHRIGISFEQQSQRYVRYKEGALDFITPRSWGADHTLRLAYETHMKATAELYQSALERGIPAEDARFVLPNATPTNFQIMVNLTELLHICDLRLCHRAQWEIRYMVGLMRAEVRKVLPELAKVMQPKCGEARLGYCDEDMKSYQACPLSAARPHKLVLLELYKNKRDLTDVDIQPPEDKS